MGRGALFFGFLLLAINGVDSFPMEDLISKLPGQPDVSFRQFGGYIDIDDKAGQSLFYYFVEAEKDATTAPLTIWLTGGPGCSAVGDSFSSVGPFTISTNGRDLQRNTFSWNKVSNLLFIDSPIGSGWSYSNTTSDYSSTDESANKNLILFLQKWFEKYPSFKSSDIYFAGSSYAGHFVPNLVNTLLDLNKQSTDLKLNIEGLALGNPLLRKKLEGLAAMDLLYARGLIRGETHEQIMKECSGIDENNYQTWIGKSFSKACEDLTKQASLDAFKLNDASKVKAYLFDTLREPCLESSDVLANGKELTKVVHGVDMCLPTRGGFYFNLQEVQKAFHGNRTNLQQPWFGCAALNRNALFKFNETIKEFDMLPTLKSILQQSIPITIFSGDVDGIVPTVGTIKHIQKLAEEINYKLVKDEAWSYEKSGSGWMYKFGDLLTFLTVKEAGHHVTMANPPTALYIFSTFALKKTA